MTSDEDKVEAVGELLSSPDLADALESEQFRHFLDQVPIAIVVAQMKGAERIVYANPEFEKVSGQLAAELEGKPWNVLKGREAGENAQRSLGTAIIEATDYIGAFRMDCGNGESIVVDAYSNVIEDENGKAVFRLAALVGVRSLAPEIREELEKKIRDRDVQLREVQHRVKNNLQMITALIRLEARNVPAATTTAHFDRLAGRIEALAFLYDALSAAETHEQIDLGVYLSRIASGVMRSHAIEGVRLDLKVDAYPVSINVAMPAGLVVNELMTNALKHAFSGREGGTITLHSVVDGGICRVLIADDGVGMPPGAEWPQRGKLGALIVQSLRENARATLDVESTFGLGTRITITFTRAAASPESGA